jgi:hypothetical protein
MFTAYSPPAPLSLSNQSKVLSASESHHVLITISIVTATDSLKEKIGKHAIGEVNTSRGEVKGASFSDLSIEMR